MFKENNNKKISLKFIFTTFYTLFYPSVIQRSTSYFYGGNLYLIYLDVKDEEKLLKWNLK